MKRQGRYPMRGTATRAPGGVGGMRWVTHVAGLSTPPGFVQFWEQWRRTVGEGAAGLEPVADDAGLRGAAGVTHVVRGVGGVELGCRLVLPAGVEDARASRGIVVSVHGRDVEEGAPLTPASVWIGHGFAELKLRLRGYPGSVVGYDGDVGSAAVDGIEDRSRWGMGQSVSDVWRAMYAARLLVGDGGKVIVHGGSMGAGLAIIAASQAAGFAGPDRLVLEAPSLGDWDGQLASTGSLGIAADVRGYLAAHADAERSVMTTLRMFDAAVHARRVGVPALVLLARSDDVVPPGAAAAVYNALGTPPGAKWRFLMERGHADDLDVLELRRLALFRQIAGVFVASEDPGLAMLGWEGLMSGGDPSEVGVGV